MILTLYILRKFFMAFLSVSLFLLAIIFLADFVEQITRYATREVSKSSLFAFSVLRLADNFLQFSPLIILLSSLFCFLRLSRSSEIVVMRAAGLPAVRFVFIPVIAVGILSLIVISLLNPVYVSARQMAKNYQSQFLGKSEGQFIVSNKNGLWLRSNDENGIQIFRLENVDQQSETLKGVTIYNYSNKTGIESELGAADAKISGNYWLLQDVRQVFYGDEITTNNTDKILLPANEGFDNFFSEFYSPKNITNFELPNYIDQLEEDNYDTKEARSYFYSELAQPILLMSLCLIGAIFALAPERMGGTIKRMLLSITAGFVVFILNRLAVSMGLAGTVPVEFSVLIIPVVSIFFATAVLLQQEDG